MIILFILLYACPCNQNIDVLICTLGFEQRTYNIIEALLNSVDLKEVHFILITYPTNKADNVKNASRFEERNNFFQSYKQIEYDRINFINQFENYLKSILKPKAKVLFDISTCASYIIYPTMKSLFNHNIELSIAYTEAEFYYPTFEQWKKVEESAHNENKFFLNLMRMRSF